MTYSSTSISGGPILSYRDNQRSLSFRGKDINVQDTEIGELVAVTLKVVPDLKTVTFSLLLPIVTVMSGSSGI